MQGFEIHRQHFYERYIKRFLDIVCSMFALIVFGWLYIAVAVLVWLRLGRPVIFKQPRPGRNEKIFNLYKFRTMTEERDKNGALLPDGKRLGKFGRALRATSLDELPEVFNILKGEMSIVGPRPQLVRDMVFMSPKQRQRHTVRPGLTGLAQINGRNKIPWEDKLRYDLEYISKISFLEDVRIVFHTVIKALIRQEGITEQDSLTAEDYGDYLLRLGRISRETYDRKQEEAVKLLSGKQGGCTYAVPDQPYSVLMSLYRKENPEYLRASLDSMLNQTAPPDEIVLVEDGPLTEALYEVLDEYQKRYPKLLRRYRMKQNLGLGLALNYGLKVCRNELIARMDTDDISKPERCRKQLERFAQRPDLAIVSCHVEEFVGDPSNVTACRRVPVVPEQIYQFGKRRSAFNHPAVMYRKSRVLEQGGYADLKRNQDVDLFGRMLYAGNKAENIDEALLWFRSSDEHARRRKSWENTWSYIAVIKKFWKMGYAGFFDYALVAAAQLMMYLMPVRLQNCVYKRLLRK